MLDRRNASRRREDHERDRLFALSLDLLAVLGLDGKVRQANESWERTLGRPAIELLGKPIADLVHEDDREGCVHALGRLKTEGVQLTFENRCRTAAGPSRWLQWTATSDVENDAIYIAARDIMGRKLAEAESARLAAIVESSNDAIVSASLAGVIESWNPAAERIFGYRASEVLGRPLAMLVPRLTSDQTPQHLGQVKAGAQVTNLEVERKKKDGGLIRVSMTLSPVKDTAGTVIATSVIAREISAKL
ncbi:MAG TPA: PAS domain S-box protein [Gemmatimonadales bacterium]|jgi:PAS domain S-box-containing protein